jgi:Asp/Glu/hydantoin racemase
MNMIMPDKKRIFLLHVYLPSMVAVDRAFRDIWPEAGVFNLLDESLYADISPDGDVPASVADRIANFLRHCELSGADGIVFTGSTFGPTIEQVRGCVSIPVLTADEGAAEAAVQAGHSILILSTAARSMPVSRRGLENAAARAGVQPAIAAKVVEGAKAALDAGDLAGHNRLIRAAVDKADGYDVIVFGQMSMEAALEGAGPEVASRIITTPRSSAMKMRSILTS